MTAVGLQVMAQQVEHEDHKLPSGGDSSCLAADVSKVQHQINLLLKEPPTPVLAVQDSDSRKSALVVRTPEAVGTRDTDRRGDSTARPTSQTKQVAAEPTQSHILPHVLFRVRQEPKWQQECCARARVYISWFRASRITCSAIAVLRRSRSRSRGRRDKAFKACSWGKGLQGDLNKGRKGCRFAWETRLNALLVLIVRLP